MADLKYMRKIQAMCRCQTCGLITETDNIDVKLSCNHIVFQWADDDDRHSPCYGMHLMEPDMTAYDLLVKLGIIDNPYGHGGDDDDTL